jgi:hypothetical protein
LHFAAAVTRALLILTAVLPFFLIICLLLNFQNNVTNILPYYKYGAAKPHWSASRTFNTFLPGQKNAEFEFVEMPGHTH